MINGRPVVLSLFLQDEVTKYNTVLEDAYQEAQKVSFLRHRDWIDSPWDTFFKKRDPLKIPTTGVEKETISHIIEKFSSVPAGTFAFSPTSKSKTLKQGVFYLQRR